VSACIHLVAACHCWLAHVVGCESREVACALALLVRSRDGQSFSLCSPAAPSFTDCRFLLTMSMGTSGLGVPPAGGDGSTTNAEVRGRHTHEGLRPLDGAFHSPRRLFSSQALLHSLPVTGGRCSDGGRCCCECTTRGERPRCGERLRCVGGGALGLGGGRVGRSGDASLCKARRVGSDVTCDASPNAGGSPGSALPGRRRHA
jgi:hypothetical protein